ncbi:DUF551 domain-containing protein (plasmid) [Cupriavidus pinatubonensis]|uniref:DUF551 domain-containing protein n=1 Tax=Cupriavidus pinatubonensis TaxID=248026 RepID=UPI001C736947|nr:DUF551 domain-containing protein [Cupriavidus pinatubonensis]QYY33655.1 DUF551 domain-containing protein [Cupriavidus pinatubonensis]
MSANESLDHPHETVAGMIRQAGGPDIVALLQSIRPEYGAPGSRDQDVSQRRKEIDAALALLERPAPDGWTAVSDAMPEEGDPLWLQTSYGKVIGGAKRWRQGWNPDYWETEDGELSVSEVTHWMPRRPPAPPRIG